jgi:hypothetical protein
MSVTHISQSRQLVQKLGSHFNPAANIQINVFKFRASVQYDEESFDEYAARLREMAKTCEFGAVLDNELRTQLIQCQI